MLPLLLKFIRGSKDKLNASERQLCGIIGGLVGVVINLIIFVMELMIGSVVNSIAITADAFHNLTDVVSSVITMLGFKLANKPADNEHPFGHGRIEYLSSLLVSFIIMLIGYEFIKTSVYKIIHPAPVIFNLVSLLLILISIPLKIFLSVFNNRLGKWIDSTTLKATSFDALSDVFILAVASVSLIMAAFTKAHIDGYLGILVAVFIMYSGFSISKNALNPLLGESPDPTIVKNIVNDLLHYKYITGVHDFIMHNYGPGKYMATIHAEMPCDVPVMKLHQSVDDAENELSKKYGVTLVIHMDPLNNNDEELKSARKELLAAICHIPSIESIHDFRIVGNLDKKNLIFDVVVRNNLIHTARDEERLKSEINESLHKLHPQYNAIVNIDRTYVQI